MVANAVRGPPAFVSTVTVTPTKEAEVSVEKFVPTTKLHVATTLNIVNLTLLSVTTPVVI